MYEKVMGKLRKDSALRYILEGLVPYTRTNLLLVYKPNRFFDELDKKSFRSRQTWRNAYWKAQKDGLIEFDDEGRPTLTQKGQQKLKPYKPVKFKNGAELMVIFDIPEDERRKRHHLRLLLRELKFKQVQKSVWVSSLDGRAYIRSEVEQYGLDDYVELFEVHRLKKK